MDFKIKKRKLYFLAFILFTFVFFSYSSLALDTRLNITFYEIVTQNVTYAENFDLVEEQKYCMINGVLNITNPGTITLHDISFSLSEVDRLATDISWADGRNGSKIAGGAGVLETITANVGTPIRNYTLLSDPDNDGNYSDYLWTNGTALVFELSTDGFAYINLSNSTHSLVSIQNAGTDNVPIEMDGVNVSSSARTFANVTILGTVKQDNLLNISDLTFYINEVPQAPVILFIPELMGGNYTTFNYNISCIGEAPPLDISTNYTNLRHAAINKKVLAGYNWTINQSVVNSHPIQPITDINITMTAANISWNGSVFPFGLEFLNPLDDYANVVGNGSSTFRWSWAPNGGTLTAGTTESISYRMTAPEAVPTSLIYLALIEDLSYVGNYLVSNMSFDSINASADIEFDFEKRINQPADNLNSSHNVTWEIMPTVYSPVNVSYNLNKVTLWVTSTLDPADATSLSKLYSGSPLMEINLTSGSWDPSADNWLFNYTDGSSVAYPPPIVWMKPEWLIKNAYGQIINSSSAINGRDLYMKYIYVVNGYWLEIQKNITSINENTYHVFTYVENIGNGWTPQYEKVTVYDFVPDEFTPYSWSLIPNSNMSVGTAGSDFYGTSYVWDIPWKGDMNSSLGPKNGPYSTTWYNYSWNTSYYVNGSGDYKVTELYIVGLDPLKVDGAFASPIITIISGIKSYSNEILYVSLVAFLIILNVLNLVITNRINRKISQRLPPAPAPKPYHYDHHQAYEHNGSYEHTGQQNQYNWK